MTQLIIDNKISDSQCVDVNRAQGEFNARPQTPMQNVMDNVQILYNHPAIPNDKMDELLKNTQEHVNKVFEIIGGIIKCYKCMTN